MELATEQVRALMKPLNPIRVAHRKQGGRELSYLEAFDVKATLIRLFGFGGFSAECIETRILRENWYKKDDKDLVQVTAMCTVKLTIHATGAVYTESGAASQSGPDHGEVADFAIKTAESDALKRAATYLGTQFGLSLYQDGSTREIVRVLLDPVQAKMLPAAGTSVSAENVKVLQDSLGATIVSQSDDQGTQEQAPVGTMDSGQVDPTGGEGGGAGTEMPAPPSDNFKERTQRGSAVRDVKVGDPA